MQIIELSHPIHPSMPVYPGASPPAIVPLAEIDTHGFEEHRIEIPSHTGTHLDVPSHMLKGGASLDQFPPDGFIGPGIVINTVAGNAHQISVSDLESHRRRLATAEFALIYTGWYRHWGQPAYFERFPCLDRSAAQWLSEMGLKGVGIDTPSFDRMHSNRHPIHKIFFSRNVILIENLTNLDPLPQSGFTMVCLPLPIERADGSPIRAVALID